MYQNWKQHVNLFSPDTIKHKEKKPVKSLGFEERTNGEVSKEGKRRKKRSSNGDVDGKNTKLESRSSSQESQEDVASEGKAKSRKRKHSKEKHEKGDENNNEHSEKQSKRKKKHSESTCEEQEEDLHGRKKKKKKKKSDNKEERHDNGSVEIKPKKGKSKVKDDGMQENESRDNSKRKLKKNEDVDGSYTTGNESSSKRKKSKRNKETQEVNDSNKKKLRKNEELLNRNGVEVSPGSKKSRDSEEVDECDNIKRRHKKKKKKSKHQEEIEAHETSESISKQKKSKRKKAAENIYSNIEFQCNGKGEMQKQTGSDADSKKHKSRKKREKEKLAEERANEESMTKSKGKQKKGSERSPQKHNSKKKKQTKKTSNNSSPTRKPSKFLTLAQEDVIHTKSKLKKDDIEMLQTQGIFIRKGKWSVEEEQILQNNMKEYQKVHNIDDPRPLIFAWRNADPDEGARLRQFAVETGFYKHLARGICRSVDLVYRRVIRFYDEQNYKGKFSEKETAELLRLQRIHGNNWSMIGGIMGRSSLSVQHKFSVISGKKEAGHWSEKELEALHNGVRAVTQTSKGDLVYKDICWNVVSSYYVKTRSAQQCRVKWMSRACWKEKNPNERKWGKADDIQLIEQIYNSSVVDEIDLDWEMLTESLKRAPSPHHLRQRFGKLKNRYCTSEMIKTKGFEAIIEFLFDALCKDGREVIVTDKALEGEYIPVVSRNSLVK